MRAFIKFNRWIEFIETYGEYGFYNDTLPKNNLSVYVRPADANDPLTPIVLMITMDREIHLATPMGESPFMESHEDVFRDLLNEDLVEYVKGEFD